jgi:hypothetical protein
MITRNWLVLGTVLALQTVPHAFASLGAEGSGGGNTLGGKLVESYNVDLDKLSGYNELYKPVMDTLNAKLPFLGLTFSGDANQIAWYLIPATLKSRSETVTGLPFPSDQVAVQKSGEVWIDQDLFNSLDPSERGKLLLHEVILSELLPEVGANQSDYGASIAGTNETAIMAVVRKTTDFLAKSYQKSDAVLAQELGKIADWNYAFIAQIDDYNTAQNGFHESDNFTNTPAGLYTKTEIDAEGLKVCSPYSNVMCKTKKVSSDSTFQAPPSAQFRNELNSILGKASSQN